MLHFYDRMKLNKLLLLVILLMSANSLWSNVSSDKNKKKLHKAENYFDKADYYKSMVLFEELLLEDPSSPYLNYHVGVCKYQLRQYRKEALTYLEKSNEKINTELYFYLGMLYHQNNQYDKALENLRKYLAVEIRDNDEVVINQLINNVTSAQKLSKFPVNVSINNLGITINSAYSDYVPLISADGTKLFFTSRREGSTDGKLDVYGEYFEDIYLCEILNGKWNFPIQLSAPINTGTHDACVGLTPEGENLLIYRTNTSMTAGDIYLSESDGVKWNVPVLLDPVINSEEWNEPSACFSPDGEVIYFSSNRPGGFGGKDIYRTVKLPNGKWSQPINLGENINTAFDDDAPFVSSNGKELFFSSKGHENMGGFDIFKSEIDSNNKWKSAMNIGFPINSVYDDIYFVLTADGVHGYYSSNKEGGFGGSDIYAIEFVSLEDGYTVMEGFIKDLLGNPISAKVTVIETDKMKVHGIYKSNRLTGKFIYLSCSDHDYELIIESEGFNTKTIYLKGEELVEIMDVELNPIKE